MDPFEYTSTLQYRVKAQQIEEFKSGERYTKLEREYKAVIRSRTTGTRVHAPFPDGYVNEVNYDDTVKAFAFLLSNECNVSHATIRKLLSELTDGEAELSNGMINSLRGEFSSKTTPERKEIINQLMCSPVMNVDLTNANVNGKSAQVLVLAPPTDNVAMYIGREKKGHEGVKETPLEDYMGTIVHDHDRTFYSYGTRYDKILDTAQEEYENDPPGEYYRDGYDLFLRLREYKESELLFLHDKRVPAM